MGVGRSISFRPMMGFMTAFSFGALKTWLEKGTHPRLLLERTLAHYGICLLFAIVWLCQAVIPFHILLLIIAPDFGCFMPL